MNRALIQSIVDSLRVTGTNEQPLASLGLFPEREWYRVLPWLDESGLGLYLLRRLDDSHTLAALPPTVRNQLQQNLAVNQRRLSVMKTEFDSLNRCFSAANVEYVVLKGFALIPEYCPDASLRSQYDYDFLVHQGSASAARHSLRAQGYSLKVKNPGFKKENESLFAAEALTIPPADESFYSPSIPRAVELHLSLWESNGDMIRVETPADVLNRKRLANCEGLYFPVLSEEDSLVLQVLHAFQHMINFWCRPSCFLEIAHFLSGRQNDADFWERFRLRVKDCRQLPHMVGMVFSMAQLLFLAPLRPGVAAWTTGALPAVLSLWVERYGREWSLARFPGSKLSLFVHRAFIEEPDTWKSVERSRLLPLHRPAQVVESGDQGFASHWRLKWEQSRYALSRLKFHLRGLLRYAWELPSWKTHLKQIASAEKRTPATWAASVLPELSLTAPLSTASIIATTEPSLNQRSMNSANESNAKSSGLLRIAAYAYSLAISF